MSAFVNLMALAVPVFTLQVYDRVIGHAGISTLVGFIIGMIIVLIFDYVLRMSRSRIMQTVALRIDVLVGHKLMELPLQELEGKPASYWQALFRDVDTVRNTLSGASALLACDLPFFFLFFTLIAMIAPPLVPVLLVIMPLFMLIAWRSAAAMSEANQNERQTSQTRDALIGEMIQGRATVKALSLDRAMGPIWADKHAENIETSVKRGSKSDFFSSFSGSLTMMTTVLMTSAGAFLIIEGAITMGGLVATNMLSGRLIGPLNQLVGQWRTFNNFKQSVERLGEVFAMESERTESEIVLNRPTGEMFVENVTFSYAEDLPPVLESVSVKLPAGGVHALVGRNGSGKTTLMKIIQGLYHPQIGRVVMDGADIAQFSRPELSTWIGYVPQETVLFAGTIRDNIIHRRPEATDEEIIKAATAAGVHHFIIDLAEGYGTEIGEAGRRLSGGQRQRISIARALVGDPPVLLLDEPSASLDRQAEQALRKTLVEIGEQRSVIIVTHSPILLAACDDLIALDKGKVALAGPAREILPKLFGQQPRTAEPDAPPAPGNTKPEDLPVPQDAGSTSGRQPPPRPASGPAPVPPARPPAPAPAPAKPAAASPASPVPPARPAPRPPQAARPAPPTPTAAKP
ncbi:MAG: ATP-binding cassette domain-containing protein, partial [Rhodospirillaceae bacterium]|nr:ATP-binding cassette domain-containing protein [Rhodospirillaceae bacterium]